MAALRYTPFYCEENIWQLAAERRDAGLASTVALVTNPDRTCALWNQRAAGPPGDPITWDYHVILLARDSPGEGWQVWDLDTHLGAPVDFPIYAAGTFAPPGRLPARFEPRFRLIAGDEWIDKFSSDREHMRTPTGAFREPPPPWPRIHREGAPGFLEWLDEGAAGPGRWLSLAELLARFGDSGDLSHGD